jgi:hypothetical protein
MVADERNEFPVWRELRIIPGGFSCETNLKAGAVAEVVDPKAAIGIEEQVLRIWRPEVVGHLVAIAVIPILLRGFADRECGNLGAAHEHMRFFRTGGNVDKLASVKVREMLAIRRPGEIFRRRSDEGAMRKDVLDG